MRSDESYLRLCWPWRQPGPLVPSKPSVGHRRKDRSFGRASNGARRSRRARDSRPRRSTPPRLTLRNTAAAVAASSGTVTSSRSGAIRRQLADIKSATKGIVGTTLLGLGRRLGPGQARRPGREALPAIGAENARQPQRPARRDHGPPSRHDDRGLRRRPAAATGLSPRHRRLLFERRREHAGGAA